MGKIPSPQHFGGNLLHLHYFRTRGAHHRVLPQRRSACRVWRCLRWYQRGGIFASAQQSEIHGSCAVDLPQWRRKYAWIIGSNIKRWIWYIIYMYIYIYICVKGSDVNDDSDLKHVLKMMIFGELKSFSTAPFGWWYSELGGYFFAPENILEMITIIHGKIPVEESERIGSGDSSPYGLVDGKIWSKYCWEFGEFFDFFRGNLVPGVLF